jgi:hypothetical protein
VQPTELDPDLTEGPIPELVQRLETLREFVSGFILCASRPAPPAPPAGSSRYKGYRHLTRGIEHLDAAICTILLPGVRSFQEPIQPGGRLSLSYHELMTVLTRFQERPWVEEAVLRMDLINAFSAYVDKRASTD